MGQAPRLTASAARRAAAPKAWRRSAALASLLGGLLFPQHQAGAVLTNVLIGSAPPSITLQVGSPGGIVDNVVFDVVNANVSPTPAPVTNASLIDFRITANRASGTFTPTITLRADSTATMKCVAGTGCGSAFIPFTQITWESINADASGGDIQTGGTFDGSASQQLARYQNNVRTCDFFLIICWTGYDYYDTNMYNRLRFTYKNSNLYPAGTYRGRVIFTATML